MKYVFSLVALLSLGGMLNATHAERPLANSESLSKMKVGSHEEHLADLENEKRDLKAMENAIDECEACRKKLIAEGRKLEADRMASQKAQIQANHNEAQRALSRHERYRASSRNAGK